MLYLVHIRIDKSDKAIITTAVDSTNISSYVSLLEHCDEVVNFKIDDGIPQEKFGYSGYTKWVTTNYEKESDHAR